MPDFLASLFKNLLEELTFKKLISVIAVLFILLVILVVFESYTSYFRFTRLESAASLYQKAEEIDSGVTNRIPELETARSNLISQINDAIAAKPLSLQIVPSTLKFSTNTLWKFLAGASFPAFISFCFLIRFKNHPNNKKAAEGGFYMALITGTVGIFVKGIYWPFFHIIVLPCLVLIGLFIVLLPIALIAIKFQGKPNNNQNS